MTHTHTAAGKKTPPSVCVIDCNGSFHLIWHSNSHTFCINTVVERKTEERGAAGRGVSEQREREKGKLNNNIRKKKDKKKPQE